MPDWSQAANCLDADPDIFFPGEGKLSWPKIEEAKAMCALCRVRQSCLEFATQVGAEYGIWGGRTEANEKACRGTRARHGGDHS